MSSGCLCRCMYRRVHAYHSSILIVNVVPDVVDNLLFGLPLAFFFFGDSATSFTVYSHVAFRLSLSQNGQNHCDSGQSSRGGFKHFG